MPSSVPHATAALLGNHAARCSLSMEPDSASLQLLADGRYRLRLRALPGEGILVSAQLQALPEPGPAREDLRQAHSRLACGTMKEQATTCSVDARERAIWLQLPAPARSVEYIDDAMSNFVNSLAFWSQASRSR